MRADNKALFILEEVINMGSRKGIPNKETRYDSDILPRLSDIKEWLMQGDTVREVCKKLAISPDSWYRYCKEHETLSDLVTMGRSVICNEVEKSLLKICTGYEYEELKTIVEEDKNGKKRTKIEKTRRHQPPSAQAISFFLRNRMPEEWSDKKELILDTSQNEEARKKLFLQMVNGELDEETEDSNADCQEEQLRQVEEDIQ